MEGRSFYVQTFSACIGSMLAASSACGLFRNFLKRSNNPALLLTKSLPAVLSLCPELGLNDFSDSLLVILKSFHLLFVSFAATEVHVLFSI